MTRISYAYNGNDQRLVDAIHNATAILNSLKFRAVIEGRSTNFYNTSRSCRDIAQTIFSCNASIKITMFSKKPRFGKLTTAYVDNNIADTIFFNTYAVGRGEKANTNTIVHETVHVVDKFHDLNTGFDFTHDGNNPYKPPQNMDSAPYWIGNRSEDLLPLLKDQKNNNKKTLSLDVLEMAEIESALTKKNWAKDAHFLCGTKNKS